MTQYSHPFRFTLLLLISSLLLSGCGFHFRGDYLIPEEVDHISITSFDDFGQLTRDVKEQLRRNGIEVVRPAVDVSNLHLISENISERTLSLYQNSRAAEKELTLRANYVVVVPAVGSHRFTTQVNRSFLDNPLTALAKSVEREMIEDEMRQQAARQIIRQLARLRTDIANQEITSEPEPEVYIDEDGVVLDPSQAEEENTSPYPEGAVETDDDADDSAPQAGSIQ